MKKIIGILSVAVIAMVTFFSTNEMNNSDMNLASLITFNTANAEIMCPDPYNPGQYVNGGILSSDCFNTNCVCQNGSCVEANWVSFRRTCGDTDPQDPNANTDENCNAQYDPATGDC